MDTVYTPSQADREQLRQPRGDVVQGRELFEELQNRSSTRVIAVGDRVSLDLVDWGVPPDIAVVDGKIQREAIDEDRIDGIPADVQVAAENPAGQVTREAWTAVREAVARTCRTRLVIDGEEDLLALPAVLYAEPDALIVYGQRETGAVILDAGSVTDFVEGLVGRRTYDRVVVGGTWDRLHAGHRSLLLAAFERGDEVDIGVTTASYTEEDSVRPYRERREQLESMLERYGLRGRAHISAIDDYQGTAVDRGDAILVTEDTADGAYRINADRADAGKPPLDIITIPLVQAEDGAPISSSRIRAGAIDRDGRPVDS